jgi:hypothetical protein
LPATPRRFSVIGRRGRQPLTIVHTILDFAYVVLPPYQAGLSSFVSFCSRLDCTGQDKP